MANEKWKLLKRKKVFKSKFINLYEDRVKLPNGRIINDYTVVELPSYVEIVATDNRNRLIVTEQYRYGVGKKQLELPAGFKEPNESPIEAAKRELEEETGFKNGKFKYIGTVNEYGSKATHKVYIVRAINLKTIENQKLEKTEIIDVKLVSIPKLKKQILEGKWKDSSSIAALAISGLLI